MMETVQAFLKVSSWPTRANFWTLSTNPLGLIVHGLCFLGVNVFAIACNHVQMLFALLYGRPVNISVCLSVCLSACLSVTLSTCCLSVCSLVRPSVCMSVCPVSTWLSVFLSAFRFVFHQPSFHSVCLPFCVPISAFVSLSDCQTDHFSNRTCRKFSALFIYGKKRRWEVTGN